MTAGEKVVGRIAVFVVMGVALFMRMRYVSSEGASAPELSARAAGVPADPCALEGVECQDLPGGGQAYVGVFDAADVQGPYSGLWLGMSCLRGAWAVEFGADGLERAVPGPVEVSWGWSGVTPEDALLVQWRLESGRVVTDQGHYVVNELADRSLYARVLDALDVNVFLAQIASREGEVLVQGVFDLRRLRRYVATVGEVCVPGRATLSEPPAVHRVVSNFRVLDGAGGNAPAGGNRAAVVQPNLGRRLPCERRSWGSMASVGWMHGHPPPVRGAGRSDRLAPCLMGGVRLRGFLPRLVSIDGGTP